MRLTDRASPERTVHPIGPRSILRITHRMDPQRSIETTVKFTDKPDANSAANSAPIVDPAAISWVDAHLPFIPTPMADACLPPPSAQLHVCHINSTPKERNNFSDRLKMVNNIIFELCNTLLCFHTQERANFLRLYNFVMLHCTLLTTSRDLPRLAMS